MRASTVLSTEEDQLEVSTLSGWVCPLARPYPSRYGLAFASSSILYPLRRPRPLRFGYHHQRGAHGAYPVNQKGLKRPGVGAIYDPAGTVSTVARTMITRSAPHTVLVLAYQPLSPA